MLGLRTLTAVLGLPILIYFVLGSPPIFFMVFLFLLMGLVIHESGKIFLNFEGLFEKIVFPLTTLAVSFSLYFDPKIFSLVIFFLFIMFLFKNTRTTSNSNENGNIEGNFNNLCRILFFALYIGIPFFLFAKLRMLPFGEKWFIILLAISWGGDTGGYFAGIYLKKLIPYKLFPLVSPNKTWVGSLGSIIFSVIAVYLFNYFLAIELAGKDLFKIAVIGNLFSQLGDLFESFLKRFYKIKDSGRGIPGHGGFLDRIDGLIFIVPFLYFYLDFFIYV